MSNLITCIAKQTKNSPKYISEEASKKVCLCYPKIMGFLYFFNISPNVGFWSYPHGTPL